MVVAGGCGEGSKGTKFQLFKVSFGDPLHSAVTIANNILLYT